MRVFPAGCSAGVSSCAGAGGDVGASVGGSVAAIVVSTAVVVASVVVVVAVVAFVVDVVAFVVVVVVSAAVVVVTAVVVVVTVLSFFWLLVVWLPAVVNASSPQTRKMPAVIAVARLRYFGSSSLSSFSKSRFTGMKMNAATAKQRKPLKVWAKIAITASTAETAKAIQRNVLFSIIASTSAVRAYAAVWHLCTAVSTHPPGRCICGRQSRMFLVHPEPECRRQDQGDTKPTGKGQKDNAGDYGSPKNFGAFLVSGVCPDQD